MPAEIRGKATLDASGIAKGVQEAKGHTDKLPANSAGAAARLGSIFGSLREKISSQFSGMTGGVMGTVGRLGPLVAGALAAAGLGGGVYGLASGIGKQIDKAVQLTDLSRQTGQQIGGLMKLQKAFGEARLDAEGLGASIGRLQNSLAGVNEDGEDTSDVFSRLGLDVGQLKTLGVAEQYAAIGRAISGLQDPLERTAAARKIWGKSGSEMLRIFENPAALAGLTGPLSTSQRLMEANARLLAQFSTAWEAFKGKARGAFGLFAGLASGLAPALTFFTDLLPKWDFSAFGARLGNAVAIGLAAIRQGTIGELLSVSLRIGIGEAWGYFQEKFGGSFSAVGDGLLAAITPIIDPIDKALSLVMTGAGLTLAESLYRAWMAFENKIRSRLPDFAVNWLHKDDRADYPDPYDSAEVKAAKTAKLNADPTETWMKETGLLAKRDQAVSEMQRSLSALGDLGSQIAKIFSRPADAGELKGLREELKKIVDPLQAQLATLRGKANAVNLGAGELLDVNAKKPGKAERSGLAVSALQRIGGGGGFGGGDPLLDVSRRIAAAAEETARNTRQPTKPPGPPPTPRFVFGAP